MLRIYNILKIRSLPGETNYNILFLAEVTEYYIRAVDVKTQLSTQRDIR